MAAEAASLGGRPQEQTEAAANHTPASERPCSISLAKLPAWPLAQTALAQSAQSASQTEHASGAEHQPSSASDTFEHTDGKSQSTQVGQPCQLQSKEKACSALLVGLKLSESYVCHEPGRGRIRGDSAPLLVPPAQDVTTADSADSSALAGACLGSELPCGHGCPGKAQQHSSAAGAAVLPEVITGRGSVAPDQTASAASAVPDMCNSVDEEGNDLPGSTAHDLRERAAASEELIGRELYIRASLLNHSCRPNCVVARSAATAAVHALRDIEVSPMHSTHSACPRRHHCISLASWSKFIACEGGKGVNHLHGTKTQIRYDLKR